MGRFVCEALGVRGALLQGKARLTGGLFSAHVPRRASPSSSFTSLRRVPRLAVPRMAGVAINIRRGNAAVFLWGLASTGHRGRVDARGQRRHTPSGLTRTTGQSADAPSRDRRGRRLRRRQLGAAPAASQQHTKRSSRSAIRAPRREASRIVGHEKERWRVACHFASGPAPCQSAGRGHRRGLDGPSMPSPPQKKDALPQRMLFATPAMRGTAKRGTLRSEVEEEEGEARRGT
jgi:hypothetical protein